MSFLSWLRAAVAVRKHLDVVAWEAELRDLQQRIDRQESEIRKLRTFDAQFQEDPRRALLFDVQQPGYASWTNPEKIEIPFHLILRNRWIYPMKMHKMTGQAGSQNAIPGQLHYPDDVHLDPMSKSEFQVTLTWKPTANDRESFEQKIESIVWFTVSPHGYFRMDDGREFEHNQDIASVAVRLRRG